MAYTKNTWLARLGTGLNRFLFAQNGQYMTLTSAPESVTQDGTAFSADWMNHLEEGVENAYGQVVSVSIGTSWAQVGSTSEYTQVVTISGLQDGDKVDLQPDATALLQMQNDGVAAIWIVNTGGTATAHALGASPTAALTVQAVITEVNA